MPDATAPTPEPKTPKPDHRRCRALRVNGFQCESWALRGSPFCYTHKSYRHPECPAKGSKIVLPLLEDHSSIQLLVTRAAHGVLSGQLDNDTARTLGYLCQVALCTLARPLAPRPKPLDDKQPLPQPVTEIFAGPDGDSLGPDEAYRPPNAARPVWSFDKYLLDEYYQLLGRPRVTRPEDLPPSGWLTEEEMKERTLDPQTFFRDLHDQIVDARQRADDRGLLPPIEERPCGYGQCHGPAQKNPCNDCKRERDQHAARKKAEADPDPDTDPDTDLDPDTNLDLEASANPSHNPAADPSADPARSSKRTAPNACRRPDPCTLQPVPCNLSPVTCPPDIKLDNIPNPFVATALPYTHPQGEGDSIPSCSFER
jgi:hypothetical protein